MTQDMNPFTAPNQPAHEDESRAVRPRLKFVAFIIAYTVGVKVLPYVLTWFGMSVTDAFNSYPWGFSPIFAFCLFGGAYYGSRGLTLLIPLATWLAGDLAIWAVSGKFEWAFYSGDQVVLYLTLAICALLGFFLEKNKTVLKIGGLGFTNCAIFFLLTNFAVWLGSTTYPQTWAGLIDCYTMALPFFRNSLIGTAVFSGILFSPFCVVETLPSTRRQVQPAADAA